MLDNETKQQFAQYLDLVESPIVFSVSKDATPAAEKLV
jgi:alkyl hydroperoxide reductase subunit F